MPHGTYNLINHSTGERFKNITIPAVSVVPSSTNLPDSLVNTKLKVDGNQLSLPDDGWYEVQNATTYQTIFEGRRSTALPTGTYNIINHTTGEKFRDISIGIDKGHDQISVDRQNDLLASELLDQLSNNLQPQVPEEIPAPNTTQPTAGDDWGDVIQDVVVQGLIGGAAGGATGGAVNALIWFSAGAASAIYNSTETIDGGTKPNDVVNETSNYNPISNVTTTTQLYEDSTYVHTTFNNNNGSSVVQHQDASGSVTTITTTNDTDATNSPQTITATDPSGNKEIYSASPTGSLYADSSNNTMSSKLVTQPTTSSRPAIGNSNSENESNSHGSNSSHSTGGLSSGTGNQTSNNPHTA